MTNSEALHNIFVRFDTIQFAVVEGIRYNGGIKESFLFSFGKHDSKIALLIVTEVELPVKLYHQNTTTSTEEKLEWLLNKYQLKVKSIVEVYDFNSKNMKIKTFNENDIMCYSFLLLRLYGEEVGVQFETYTDGINLNQFVDDYYDIVNMVTNEEPRYRIGILGENPIAYARRMKLDSIDIVY